MQDSERIHTLKQQVAAELAQDDAERSGVLGLILALVAVAAFFWVPFLPWQTYSSPVMMLGCAAITLCGAWTWWCVRHRRYSKRVYRVFLVVSVLAGIGILVHLGPFSPAPIAVTLGIAFFAANEDARWIRFWIGLTIAVYLLMAAVFTFDILPDIGLLDANSEPLIVRLFFLVMVPFVFLSSFFAARMSRRASIKLIDRLEQALLAADATKQQAEQAYQDAEQAARMKTEFLANMSHEIRTPMNAIIGMGDLLAETPLNDDQKHMLQIMSQGSHSLLALINDILDISRIEAGKLEFAMEPFQLNTVVEQVYNLFLNEAKRKSLHLNCQIKADLAPAYLGDSNRIRQVLTNLVGNALKFTEHGSVIITVSKKQELDQRHCILFEVQDSGVGIAEEALANVFNAFVQVDGSSTRRAGGTGLGLAICQQTIELMGGRIGVHSALHKGSLFWFELDLQPSKLIAVRQAEQLEIARNKTGQARLLVAEDNEVNRIVIKALLERMGYDIVEYAENGKQALEKSKQMRFDAILLDCQMPEMDGYTAAKEIRVSGNMVPIIGVSAHAFETQRQDALAAGMDDYLTKPIQRPQLEAVLNKWIGQRLG